MAKILIVDDSETALEFSAQALEKGGHEVLKAKGGLEANKFIFSKDKPDLVLLDIMMPLLNGDKVFEAFKQSEISRSIPVVFYSTKSEEELEALTKKHGNLGYIKKPLPASELLKTVNNFLA